MRPNCLLAIVALPAALMFYLLAGCGPVKRVNPPAATVQRLALVGDTATIDLRLQNHSYVETRFGRIDLSLSLEGQGAAKIDRAAGVTAAPLSVEIVTITLSID